MPSPFMASQQALRAFCLWAVTVLLSSAYIAAMARAWKFGSTFSQLLPAIFSRTNMLAADSKIISYDHSFKMPNA